MHSELTDVSGLIPKPTYESMHPLVEAGLINDHELELMLAETELFLTSEPVIMLSMLMACGEKAVVRRN